MNLFLFYILVCPAQSSLYTEAAVILERIVKWCRNQRRVTATLVFAVPLKCICMAAA